MFAITYFKKVITFLKKTDGEKRIDKRLIHGVSWNFISSVFVRSITFIIALVHSHILGKEGYGELGIILNTLILFSILSTGYGATCSKYISELKDISPERANRIITLSTILTISFTVFGAVLLFLNSGQIASKTLNTPNLTLSLKIASFVLISQSIIGVCDGVLYGLQVFKIRGNLSIIQPLIWLPTTAYCSSKWQLNGALMAYVISFTIAALAYVYISFNECRKRNFVPTFNHIFSEVSVILNFTLPVIFNSLLVIPTNWLCSVILANQENGFIEVGGYNAAYQWKIIVLQIPFFLQATVSPMMSESLGKKDFRLFNQLFKTTYKIILSAALSASLIGMCLSRKLMTFFGQEFASEYDVMILVMIMSLVVALSGFIGNTLLIINKTWVALVINLVLGVVALILTYILSPRYGSAGLCISFIIAYFLQSIVSIYLLSYFFRKIRFGKVFKYIVIAVVISSMGALLIHMAQIAGFLYCIIVTFGILFYVKNNVYKDFVILRNSQHIS